MTNDQAPMTNGMRWFGHWSLVIGHWSLVIGHWSLVIDWSFLYAVSPAGTRRGRTGTTRFVSSRSI